MKGLDGDRPDYLNIVRAPTTAQLLTAEPMLRVRITGQTGNVGHLLAHLPAPTTGGSLETDPYAHTIEVMINATSTRPLLENIESWIRDLEALVVFMDKHPPPRDGVY